MAQPGISLSRLLHEEDGTISVFSTMMTMVILLIAGASIDIMNHEAKRVALQGSLDRAVLAAADLDQERAPEVVVNDYVTKLGMGEHLASVSAVGGGQDRTVNATAGMTMQTVFLHMAGYSELPVNAASVAEERISNVEISLVLDISGSMRFNNRMENLRPAASSFVRKVLTEDTNGVTTLNLVPFAGQVNPGTSMFDYFRGERPKIKQGNNGWGNGDQDAPGGSLCNNNAENADEGASDPSCQDGVTVDPATTGYFPAWGQAISNVVIYFDTDRDDIFDRAHKIESFPESAPRDMDEIFEGAVAFIASRDPFVTTEDFIGISIKGGNEKTRYFQVKGDTNFAASDLGPTKNTGKIKGSATYHYNDIDYAAWAAYYTPPTQDADMINVNMPSSCVEILDAEFGTTALPQSSNYIPHFQYWPIDRATMDWGWCPEDDTSIQYYSDDADALVSFINNMRLHDGTGIQHGLKYALALLDPDTQGAVSYLISRNLVDNRFAGRPMAWEDTETEKYIVVMSDGQVTDQYRPYDPHAAENGELDLKTQGRASYEVRSSRGNNLDNMYTQCQLAKDLGVTVFAIAFETSQSAADELELCASSESHFFHVHGDEIRDTFDTIARQINNLRLIQ